MARVPAGLPAGLRLSDHISLGVVARTFPIEEVRRVLAETGKASQRERDLPAQVMVYYAIALALYTTSGRAGRFTARRAACFAESGVAAMLFTLPAQDHRLLIC